MFARTNILSITYNENLMNSSVLDSPFHNNCQSFNAIGRRLEVRRGLQLVGNHVLSNLRSVSLSVARTSFI